MKAKIIKDTKNSVSLWLLLNREDPPVRIKGIMGMLRTKDSAGNVAFPFLEDEIEAIKEACEAWLNK